MKRLSAALYALIALGAVVAASVQPGAATTGGPDPLADAAALVAGLDDLLDVNRDAPN